MRGSRLVAVGVATACVLSGLAVTEQVSLGDDGAGTSASVTKVKRLLAAGEASAAWAHILKLKRPGGPMPKEELTLYWDYAFKKITQIESFRQPKQYEPAGKWVWLAAMLRRKFKSPEASALMMDRFTHVFTNFIDAKPPPSRLEALPTVMAYWKSAFHEKRPAGLAAVVRHLLSSVTGRIRAISDTQRVNGRLTPELRKQIEALAHPGALCIGSFADDGRIDWVAKEAKALAGLLTELNVPVPKKLAKLITPAEAAEIRARRVGQDRDIWEYIPDTAKAKSLVVDRTRRCVWFISEDRLGKIEFGAEKATYVAEVKTKYSGMALHKLVREGNRLWMAGFATLRKRRGEGGGLACYDIPTKKLTIYRVSNTQTREALGLQCNDIHGLTVYKGDVWLYGMGDAWSAWGLTRFRPREKAHSRRWVTYTGKNTESCKGALDGLASGFIDAVVPVGDRLLLFFPWHSFYQELDPQTINFEKRPLLTTKAVGVSRLNEKEKIGWIGKMHRFVAAEGDGIWFLAPMWVPAKWAWTADLRHGGPYRVDGLLHYRSPKKPYRVFSPRTTESSPGAWDGIASLAIGTAGNPEIYYGKNTYLSRPISLCFNGDDIWIARDYAGSNARSPGLTRYHRPTRSSTRYPLVYCNAVSATKDTVWVATVKGVARFRKSAGYPKVTSHKLVKDKGTVGISVTFSMPMNPGSFTPRAVVLVSGKQSLLGKVTYDSRHRRMLFELTDGKLPAGKCTLVLTSLVQGANGNPLRKTRIALNTALQHGKAKQ